MSRRIPFRIKNLRAARKKPGLLPRHLIAVQAAAKICKADGQGIELRSLDLASLPHRIAAADYRFDIGNAVYRPRPWRYR